MLKEVQIVHLTKQRARDREELHEMNIVLDSKQQELGLVGLSRFLYLC